ncbi:hypothetical protein TNCV_3695231 [Trichonephila clavipes]|nr:hypothetical protein TNCV_3695231 [Trichonephila clavipes]
MCTAPIMTGKDNLEFSQIPKNIVDADSEDENEIKRTAAAFASSEMRNTTKGMRSYLDAHTNVEINKDMDDIEH